MKDMSYFSKVFLAVKPVDFRKQARGLSAIVQEGLSCIPTDSRSIFVFTNRRKDSVRMLYWDTTGFALWSKVLEKDRFVWPKVKDGSVKVTLSSKEIKWLLQGIDLSKIKMHTPCDSTEIF